VLYKYLIKRGYYKVQDYLDDNDTCKGDHCISYLKKKFKTGFKKNAFTFNEA
jgi:hypothetical protein